MLVRDLSNLSIFVVDDNRQMLNLFHTMLSALKVRNIKLFLDPADALDALRMSAPDLVITDWNMSPLTGMELFHRIRKGGEILRPDVPVLIVTGYAEIDKVMEAKREGVSGFLTKPVSAKLLYERIVLAIDDGHASPAPQAAGT
ncbi:MAG: response regulator [Alphaproteobacteria bacterium]|nr:response regulator [Alphaproteobacteria bacterium]